MPKLELDQGGTAPQRTPTIRQRKAAAEIHESHMRLYIGGGVVVLLAIAYIAALFRGTENSKDILVILGSSLGFLLGGRARENSE